MWIFLLFYCQQSIKNKTLHSGLFTDRKFSLLLICHDIEKKQTVIAEVVIFGAFWKASKWKQLPYINCQGVLPLIQGASSVQMVLV